MRGSERRPKPSSIPKQNISETIDGSAWETITGILWENGTPWQLSKFEGDVSFEGSIYRCVIVEKIVFDPDDVSAVDYAEDLFTAAWEI